MIGARIRKSEPLPEVVAWRRTDATFGQPGSLVIGSLAMTMLGTACHVRTGAPWLVGWSAATLVVLLARLLLARAYWRQEPRQNPELWARRFTIGAWSTGVLWAVISVVMVTEGDPLTHLLVLAVQGGFFAGAAARNSPLPAAAQGTLALGLGPMLLACLVNGEPTYLVLACFVFLHLMAGIGVARFLGRQTVGLLLSNEEKAELVREIGRANAGLAEANARLEAIASTDALTGLTNRRGFDTALQALWSRAAQDGTHLALALIDVDRFKQFNDRLGHPAGDACLRALGQALQGAVRQGGDIVARYGGEEMAVLLPGMDAEAAMGIAERLRLSVEELRIAHPSAIFGRVTVSVGVASLVPDEAGSPAILLARADTALYAAKAGGRNCASLAEAA